MLNRFLARQSGHPTGLLGWFVLGPLWNRRNAALNDLALAQLDLRSDDRVLEVGFGGGYLLGRMAAAVTEGSLDGVDISLEMADFVAHRHRDLIRRRLLTVYCAPAENLPFPDRVFTKACSVNSLFYWSDPAQALAEIARVLQDRGRLVLVFTDRASLERKGFAGHGLRLHDASEGQKLLTAAGFRLLRSIDAEDRHRRFTCLVGER